ncbi:hypothetical protein CXF72_13555 [Psychromonas sp. MB-3u-54]|nr:hypothetical protein CXF72_13555 [Psychromonas sp. MB-3u-54]
MYLVKNIFRDQLLILLFRVTILWDYLWQYLLLQFMMGLWGFFGDIFFDNYFSLSGYGLMI